MNDHLIPIPPMQRVVSVSVEMVANWFRVPPELLGELRQSSIVRTPRDLIPLPQAKPGEEAPEGTYYRPMTDDEKGEQARRILGVDEGDKPVIVEKPA